MRRSSGLRLGDAISVEPRLELLEPSRGRGAPVGDLVRDHVAAHCGRSENEAPAEPDAARDEQLPQRALASPTVTDDAVTPAAAANSATSRDMTSRARP